PPPDPRPPPRRPRSAPRLPARAAPRPPHRVKGGWTSTGEPWVYDAERYAWVARQRSAEQQAMRDYAASTGCRMEFLRRQLDDEEAVPCGRCDNCAGARFTADVSGTSLDTARGELSRPGVELEPRKMWPTGLAAVGVDLKGRIPAGEQASTGRALGRLSDIGWGNRLRPMLAPQTADQPVPDDVAQAVVAVLADWARGPGGWATGAADAPARPVGVVALPSRSRPLLVGSLAARIAEVGRIPLLGTLEYTDQAPEFGLPSSNSAQRVRGLHQALTVPQALAASLSEASGPVFLVDDRAESGWTLAVAARLLRRAGAKGVFPLVLALQP
ncbi:RecQ family zinc-binding domain-containing protein, partial [Streptomyces lavendulae]|uniref:RecQ family zinc-binding domain-containing protein n=1 Tax=Streptomyces lavendulae TaxID=1914 RepID=UPI003687291D